MTRTIKRYWKPVEWPAERHVRAYYTIRKDLSDTAVDASGINVSSKYADFNLAMHVGDRSTAVASNRASLSSGLDLPSEPIWLNQVHGVDLLELVSDPPEQKSPTDADGSFTTLRDKVCCVMTADCLPVLLSDRQGRWVAAVHAGWRGLAEGVIEQSIASYSGNSEQLIAWLGPAISQLHFVVGAEVRAEFLGKSAEFESAFIPQGKGKYKADLYAIARVILQRHGIEVYGGDFCTYQDSEHFYSYRRDGETGRMASLIWINS